MKPLQVLASAQDASVNFIEEQLAGFLEARYVRKCDDYLIGYLSSQTGCNRGCTFCHLTATGQTSFKDSTHGDFLAQAMQVLKHYRRQTPARYMHWNFMARGEPLCNQVIVATSADLLTALGRLSLDEGLPAKFNVSTIMPLTLKPSLMEVFPIVTPTIYYSLYSVNEDFRKKWLPAAMPYREALGLLHEYHRFSKKIVKIHHAFIEGENDSDEDIDAVCDAIDQYGLSRAVEFNLVRYNPFSPAQGRESPEATTGCLERLNRKFPGVVKVIPRVGPDVHASCGMFVEKEPSLK